jgi:hypothetical protein
MKFSYFSILDTTGTYWDTTGSVAVTVTENEGQLNNLYLRDDTLYIPDGSLGYIYEVTTPLTSTSYPYSTTILLEGFTAPTCAIISSQGYTRMYVSDQFSETVYQYVGGSSTNYQPIFGGGPDLAGLDVPSGLAFDSTENNIYISDQNNHRVLMISVSSTPGTNGVLVAVSDVIEFIDAYRSIHLFKQ